MNPAAALDAVIGLFSPKAAYERALYRKARYAAAKTHRLTGSWSPVDQGVNKLIAAAAGPVRARVRQLVRDFPYFHRACNLITDYVVGSGILFQSKVQDPDGNLNKAVIQKIEDAFSFWADEADVSKKLHFYEMMALAKTQDSETGEFFLIQRWRPDNRYIPFCLQMIEADHLTGMGTPRPGNKLEQGVEYNPGTGETAAYHFADPEQYGAGSVERVAAADVIHGFKTVRPGQIRGISPFTPAVLVAHDLSEYMDAEIDAAKMAAKYLAFVKTPDPYARQMAVMETNEDTGQKIEEMQNAILEYLRPGEDVEIAKNPRPGENFTPFVKFVLQMVAITMNLPYELVSGDYIGMNYSTMRVSRNDFTQQLKPHAARHIRHYAMPILKAVMVSAVITGRLALPGFGANPIPYYRCIWHPPGMEPVDPLREAKARIEEISYGLRSPQEVVSARGRDIEDVYREIAAARDLAEDYGLSFEKPSTALANNPAAINDETDKGEND